MPAKPKRAALDTKASTLVAVWIPNELLAGLDQVVRADDSDRSKTIRKALRRHLGKTA